MKNISIEDFNNRESSAIVIDVRTPAEYEKGHIVGAVNMPLFSNEERAVVGTIYKKQGKDEAVEKGLEFVGLKMHLFVKTAKKLVANDKNKKIILYCWRGGMRSNSVAWLLATAGYNVEVIKGGYKNYRGSFIDMLNNNKWKFIILGGPTGCGKTDILQSLKQKGEQVIDLEFLAKHRGSAFGVYGHDEPQPTSEQFTNLISHELLKLDDTKLIWCEGESMSIGKVFMPQELYRDIQNSNFIYFTLPREVRIEHIVRDYGECPIDILVTAFENISKRLGYDNAKDAIEAIKRGDIKEAAEIAMVYYDKGYNHSISQRIGEVIHRLEADNDDPNENACKLIEIKNKFNI